MTSNTLGAIALEKYRTEEELKLLDTIDYLRSQGVGEHISLPQLIVCGNQSSGKSSVLEAISGLPFESKDTLVRCIIPIYAELTPSSVSQNPAFKLLIWLES